MIIVKKFGGTSVETIEKITRIAEHLASEKEKGDDIVVVVSAMGKTTDELFRLAYEITRTPNQREMDMLLTAGERITMALLSLSLQKLNVQSISFTGSQSGIITDTSHGNAKILNVNAFRISEELLKGKIVIVAGFQGVSLEKEITTLGRGGSDTTAVALASFLKADRCEIFTDVDGVYQADPRLLPEAKKIDNLSFEEMLYLSYTGAKVLHSRAVEFAYKYKMPVEVKSLPLSPKEGTMIKGESTMENVEKTMIKAVSHKENIRIFDVYISYAEIPLFTTEIFDIEVNVDISEPLSPPSPPHSASYMGEADRFHNTKTARVYIEDKYKEKFINELNDNELTYQLEREVFTIINLLGYRINRDIAFLSKIYSFLKENCKNLLSIKNQGIGVQLTIEQSEAKQVIDYINREFL